MSAARAALSLGQGVSQPDIAWIRKNVTVMDVARELGLRIVHGRTNCWRPENHAHGDADPSLHLHRRDNRVKCFVCQLSGSNVDLVMGILNIGCGDAVRWVADRFPVPNIKRGRPLGHRTKEPQPYRAGVHGSELEVLMRSGMFGLLSSAASRILLCLELWRDLDSGVTTMSYRAIMRYSGVASRKSVSHALAQLQKLHAVQVSQGTRVGITRQCSTYRVTLDDPEFLERCNEVCRNSRQEIQQERTYRQDLRLQREKKAREEHQIKQKRLQIMKAPDSATARKSKFALNTTKAGGLRPPAPPVSTHPPSQRKPEENTSTCKGLNLSSSRELRLNKAVPIGNRKIGAPQEMKDSELRASVVAQKKKLNEYLAAQGMPTV